MKPRHVVALAVLASVLALSPGLEAYLKLGTTINGRALLLKWARMPVRYYVTNRDVPGATAPQLQAAVDRAFKTWGAPDDVSISSQFGGFVANDPFEDDGISVIGFLSVPEQARTLGATTFTIDILTGEIIESDIFLNSAFDWSMAAAGDPARYDVESITTHELGHLLGLGHSALGETEPRASGGRTILGKRAVMFPIAYPRGNVEDRTIEADDIAGITDVYGGNSADRQLGSISGRVTRNGTGVFGAHLTAFNPATGEMVSGFSLTTQGSFTISALKPGLYILRVEPLDDADIDSFFDQGPGDPIVDIDFKPTYYSKQVAVPAGGTSGSIEIRVTSK